MTLGAPPVFSSFQEFQAHMDRLGMFHMDLGLERMEQGLARLGIARDALPVVHVVGTNGKGSVCACLESLALTHGGTVGVFTSPHFLTLRERIRINGRLLSESEWTELANAVMQAVHACGATYFEVVTLIAALAFARAGLGLVVLEAGLGGTHDATCVFDPLLTVLTPVGLDHQSVLGPDLVCIARDKAGAVRGVPVICAPQGPEAAGVIAEAANRTESEVVYLASVCRDRKSGRRFAFLGLELDLAARDFGLPGAFQQDNAMLALAAWVRFRALQGLPVDREACLQGVKRAVHPGRLQQVRRSGYPCFLLDGAHNIMAMTALQQALFDLKVTPSAVIFSCMQDKNPAGLVDCVRSFGSGPIIVPGIMGNERACDPAELAELVGERGEPAGDMAAALERVRLLPGTVLICGSLFLLAEFYRIHPEALFWNLS